MGDVIEIGCVLMESKMVCKFLFIGLIGVGKFLMV